MKGLVAFVVALLLGAGIGVLTYAQWYPLLPVQVRQSLPPPGSTSSPSPSQPTRISFATLPASAKPTSAAASPSANPAVATAPAAISIPASTAPPAPTSPSPTTSPWSSTTCQWAAQTMSRDEQLDLQTYHRLDGTYFGWFWGWYYGLGDSAGVIAAYNTWQQRWGAVVSEIDNICGANGTVSLPSTAMIQQAQGWFETAIQSHVADTQVHPDHADWNNGWVSAYTELHGLYDQIPMDGRCACGALPVS